VRAFSLPPSLLSSTQKSGRPRHGHCFLIKLKLSLFLSLSLSLSAGPTRRHFRVKAFKLEPGLSGKLELETVTATLAGHPFCTHTTCDIPSGRTRPAFCDRRPGNRLGLLKVLPRVVSDSETKICFRSFRSPPRGPPSLPPSPVGHASGAETIKTH